MSISLPTAMDTFWTWSAPLASTSIENPTRYCQVNPHVPALRVFFDDSCDLRPDYRLSRETLNNLFHHLRDQYDHGWGLEIEILVFVFWLASATSYRVVSRAFDIPRSTVNDIIHRVAHKIKSLESQIIHLPSVDNLEEIGLGFAQLAGSQAFRIAVGAIDGCQVRIKPPTEDANCYLNRKLFYSIQLQAVCDHKSRFIDIYVGWPGSVHDSRVLKNSPIFTQRAYPPDGCCILGDGGYPCISKPIALMTPYREPVRDPVRARFNHRHSKARNIIERSFGMMKTRWRTIFFKALEVKPSFAHTVVTCCAILHNLCITSGDILEPEQIALRPDDNDDAPEYELADVQDGDRLRDRLAASVSAPVAPVAVLMDHDYDV
uniref:putative nuclease HARBI1 n=1 Tax=Centroberyx gerrardi TaxID=166262 RepID=UPI003AAEB172